MASDDVPLLRLVGAEELAALGRQAFDPAIVHSARTIVERVRSEGDAALVDLPRRFDGVDCSGRIEVPREELEAAAGELPAGLQRALDRMRARLEDLHARQVPREWWDERDGVRFGETVRPVAAAGAYVPGGRAAYPSTVLMTAVPARVAGVG